MSDTPRVLIPKWPSLGPISVFRGGPWEAIVLIWLAGASALAIWLMTPALRIATVLDPIVATAIGAALLGAIAVRVGARLSWTPQFGQRLAAGMILVGAGLGWLASRTLFAPLLDHASPCAPPFPVGLSTVARAASWIVPVVMWMAWCLYLTARMPVIEQREHMLPSGAQSRYLAYSHALRSILPFRLALTVVLCAALVGWVRYRVPALENETSAAGLSAALRDPFVGTFDRENGGPAFHRLAAARKQKEVGVLAALASLDFDSASAQVHPCGCEWLAPGDVADRRIAPAIDGFAVLDEQIAAFRSYAWEPSPATAAAIVKILPLGGPEDLAALFPGQWNDDASVSGPGESDDAEVRYKNEVVVILRRTTIGRAPQQRLIAVGVQLLGRAAHDTALPQEVSQRLGKTPSTGPCPVRGGGYCTVWDVGKRKVRLGAEREGASSPMWLVIYDERFLRNDGEDCCSTVSGSEAT
jgi:hypothetical protein